MLTTVNETELREILEITPADQNIMIAGKHGIGNTCASFVPDGF